MKHRRKTTITTTVTGRTLRGEGLKRQLVAPRPGSLAGVGADLEDVVGGRSKSVDDDGRLGGVGRPVVGRVPAVVVEQLVHDDLAVTVLAGRRLPLQSHARRTLTHRREVERSAGRNCDTHPSTVTSPPAVSETPESSPGSDAVMV